MSGISTYLFSYSRLLKELINKLDGEALERITDVLAACRERGDTIYVCGNGGSLATAAHFVCDLAKPPQGTWGKPFKAIALGCNSSLATAAGNDLGYDETFAAQLEPLIMHGDVVIGISASGNSPNVLSAIAVGNARGCETIGICGWDGGKLSRLAKHSIVVKHQHFGRVEDAHMIICHIVAYWFAENCQPTQQSQSAVGERIPSDGQKRPPGWGGQIETAQAELDDACGFRRESSGKPHDDAESDTDS